MRTIPLHGKRAAGRVALVDDEDYELVSRYRWSVRQTIRSGRHDNGPYAYAYLLGSGRAGQVSISMHRLITGYAETDHVNHDGLDNQRANLRPATRVQNLANRRSQPGLTSPFKGVSWHTACRKWRTQIDVDGKRRHLGCFLSEEDAARAYDQAALTAWGKYAHLNFPEESAHEPPDE
jgi:AP2 domain